MFDWLFKRNKKPTPTADELKTQLSEVKQEQEAVRRRLQRIEVALSVIGRERQPGEAQYEHR